MANEALPTGRSGRLAAARPLLTEITLLLVLFAAYKWGRQLVEGSVGTAMGNAADLWGAERSLGLPDEIAVQRWALGWDHTAFLANLYYVGVHFPGTTLLLGWLWARHRASYKRVRNELVALTAFGMAVHMAYPLAPPRLAGLGAVDTMLTVGPSAYPEAASGIANQYAAMPSLHIGWALVVAVAVLRVSRSRWRWAVALHAPVTVLVVVVTANHYWLDGVVAAVLLALAVAVVAAITRWRRAARTGEPAQQPAAEEPALAPAG
ncbi:phosphatase PAP2 family protein [Actinomadura macrotermitis]|uniref:Inositolphosphotransferase Aur1/Ipt1 domain-containing protein n=1 Tax=Actinomadura macrotermitis TaxID=2585200 RepID=A0A7K0C3K6_9ACTN|nr:phosphatase PAP2 family protein [Actinomadura macrotermitis]MQY08029.1 hypothetical protein [Actinomadura macrotermitis]